MKKITILVFLMFALVACNKDDKDVVETKKNETTEVVSSNKVDPPKATKEEDDSHAGHDHDHQSNPNDLPYIELDTPYATGDDSKVVVYEFFGYVCGHCYNFEPQMSKWAETKPDYVEIVKVPLNFQQGWGVLQQAYLTASSMGIADENHAKLFEAIHKQRKVFRTIEELASWYADNSKVTKEAFLSTAKSFIIDSQQRKADKMGYEMKITGTPTIVVNGKYKPTNKLKSREDVITTMNELIEKEAKVMGLLKP